MQDTIPIISNPFQCLTSGADSKLEDAMEALNTNWKILFIGAGLFMVFFSCKH